MQFNPDLNEQAQETIFLRMKLKPAHPSIHFNDASVAKHNVQKHLGLFLDQKLNFNHHMKEKLAKAMKGFNIIRKLSNGIPRHSLATIYKSFARPHLHYGDVAYDQTNNDKFCQRTDSMQCNPALAIIKTIKGTSQIKLYEELGLESLTFRR